jgi:2-polyprenyl-6-methoxyphenol hydroxylase-like FAD-dependent oxidoreductase
VLDKLLVDAAVEAGVEVREEFLVEDVVHDGDRVSGIRGRGKGIQSLTEHARVVVGADGRHSVVAKAVKPEQYQEKPQLLAAYYTYWSGLPMNGRFEAYIRDHCSFAVWPTNDDCTLVIAGWPYSEFEEKKKDVEGNYHRVIDQAPEFAKRLRGARREERFVGTAVRATSGSRTGTGGRSWETRDTTRTSSRRWGSPMRSRRPSSVCMR